MLRTNLRTRIILTYVVIFLVSTAIMTVWAGTTYARVTMERAQDRLLAEARMVAAVAARRVLLREGAPPQMPATGELEGLSQDFAAGYNTLLSVLSPAGEVMATTATAFMPSQAERPEIVAALAGRVVLDTRYDASLRREMIFTALPIYSFRRTGQPVGLVQLGLYVDDMYADIRGFWLRLALMALVAAAAAVLAGWWLASQVVRPVSHLRDAAAGLAAGNLDERVPAEQVGGVMELDQLAAAFNNMAERIQEMMGRQRAFVANASHELRTPITNIKLRAEALGTGALTDQPLAERFANEIESEADRLGRLASDLLTLSRQDAAPLTVRQAVDVAAVAASCAEEMRMRAERARVSLNLNIAPALPTLHADPAELRSALVNLLDNALQHTPAGGTVTLWVKAEGSDICMEVADTGVGIPAEDLPHIFERFYRADKARSRQSAAVGSGAGLGLAIVKGIVEGHGGTVAAESTLGQGTMIRVLLPQQTI